VNNNFYDALKRRWIFNRRHSVVSRRRKTLPVFVKSELTNFVTRHDLLLCVYKFEPEWRILIFIVLEPIMVTFAKLHLRICYDTLLPSESMFSFKW